MVQPIFDDDDEEKSSSSDQQDEQSASEEDDSNHHVDATHHSSDEAEMWKDGPAKKHDVELKLKFSKRRAFALVVAIIVLVGGLIGWKFDVYGKTTTWYNAASVTITILEKDSRKPVPAATVTIDTVIAKTNPTGTAELTKLKSGKVAVTITKEGYLPKSFDTRLYRGINPLPDAIIEKAPEKTFSLSGTIVDAVSQSPITKAKITVSEQDNTSDDTGAFNMQVKGDVSKIRVTKEGYDAYDGPLLLGEDQTFAPLKIELLPQLSFVFEQEKSGKVNLYTVSLSNATPTALLGDKDTAGNSTPAVSPDQKTVLFLSDRDSTTKLYLRDQKGNITKVSDDANPIFARFVDNNTIIYVYMSNANSPTQSALVSYRIDSKKRTVISNTPAADTKASVNIPLVTVSSDGQLIAYQMLPLQTSDTPTINLDDLRGIYTVKPDGKDIKKVLNPSVPYINKLYFADANKSLHYSFNDDTGYRIHSVDLATTQDKDITASPTILERTYVRDHGKPDLRDTTILTTSGKYIYIDTRNGKSDVFTSDKDGKNEVQITQLGTVQSIALSQSEKYVLVGSSLNNDTSLYVVGAAGGSVKKITPVYSLNAGFLSPP